MKGKIWSIMELGDSKRFRNWGCARGSSEKAWLGRASRFEMEILHRMCFEQTKRGGVYLASCTEASQLGTDWFGGVSHPFLPQWGPVLHSPDCCGRRDNAQTQEGKLGLRGSQETILPHSTSALTFQWKGQCNHLGKTPQMSQQHSFFSLRFP